MRKITSVSVFACLLLLGFSNLTVAVDAEDYNFGLRTQIWPHMWKGGIDVDINKSLSPHQRLQWNASEKSLGIYNVMGAEWNIVIVRHRIDSKIEWVRLNKIIDVHKQSGITIMFRLVEDPGVYENLSDKLDPESGYNDDYYKWVYSIAERYQKQVRYYMIGNEVDHDLGHNLLKYKKTIIDYDKYEKLLKTASKAIKSVNPVLNVVDHGVSGFTLGLAVATSIKEQSGLVAAYQFWNIFHYNRLGVIGGLPWFTKMINSDSTKRRVGLAKETYMNCKALDAVQLHHYFSPESLPQILEWIRNKLKSGNCATEIIATEIGYRIPYKKGKTWDGRTANVADWDKYSSTEHAITLVKDFTILLSNNINHILYWQARFHHDRSPTATLFDSSGKPEVFNIKPAGTAYKFFVKKIDGAKYIKKNILNRENLHESIFASKTTISVAWSNDEPIRLTTNEEALVRTAWDIYGNKIELSGNNEIVITSEPMYLEWWPNVGSGPQCQDNFSWK